MKTAYLGLGSNLADRLGILRTAIDRLRRDELGELILEIGPKSVEERIE